MSTILVIDDNPAVATALEVLFSLHDIASLHADSPAAGLALLDNEAVDLVIQDMNFSADTTSGDEGRELFAAIRQRHPDLPVVLLTAWTHLESAVELIKAGAADYVAKPWQDAKLLATVNNLLELAEARRELDLRRDGERRRRDDLARRYDLRGAVFADPASERVVALACQVARSDLPVLVTGPNGSGKEKIAEIIQANSAHRDGPFVAVTCGALPAELIEAELFGAGMRQRGDRRQRVVQLMADHADDLLPGLHFLSSQLIGQQAQQQQLMLAAVEAEMTPCQVIHLFLVVDFVAADREQAIAAALHRYSHLHGCACQQVVETLAFQFPAAVQQLACGHVGEHHPALAIAAGSDQQHRHRRVLHHRVQQQFALHQSLSLFAQHVAQFRVRAHQVAQVVASVPVDAEVVLAVAIGADTAG